VVCSPAPASPDGRLQKLLARRALKMARSAHAYVRGSTQQFYDWLTTPGAAQLPSGPPIWICGDAHVGNVGPVGRSDGAPPVLELRDLDQTVIGNPAHDLVRLGLSLAMAARSSDLPGVTTARMTEELVAGYENAFAGDEVSIEGMPAPIKFVMKRALRRNMKDILREELEPSKRKLQLGRRFWPLTDAERHSIEELAEQPTLRRLVTQLSRGEDDTSADIKVLDAAYWVKGCSSLGLWRAAVLVGINGGKKKSSLCLLDLKQAIGAVTPHTHPAMPQARG